MKHLLYIGHEYHLKTQSTAFLREIFETDYQIDYIALDPQRGIEIPDSLEFTRTCYDAVVFFQLMPPLDNLLKKLTFSSGALFPMYDGCMPLDDPIWEQYKSFTIINFSITLHKAMSSRGWRSQYIQYFPEPKKDFSLGNQRAAFLWQRIAAINANTASHLLTRIGFDSLHVHNASDPGEPHVDIISSNIEGKTVTYSSWFENKESLLKEVEKASIYIAPRTFEGIGMSFLEAMSMGRCVIAPDNPTMSEYITHGKTGLLYNPHISLPTIEPPRSIRAIQLAAYNYIREGFRKWQTEKLNILSWTSNQDLSKEETSATKITPEYDTPQVSASPSPQIEGCDSEVPKELYPCTKLEVLLFGTVPLISVLRRDGRPIKITLLGYLDIKIAKTIYGYE